MKVFPFLKKTSSISKEDIGMDNVIDSIFNSKPLYDSLKVKCHPDLFLNEELKKQAESLFQRLQKAKYDVRAMKDMEDEIDVLYDKR